MTEDQKISARSALKIWGKWANNKTGTEYKPVLYDLEAVGGSSLTTCDVGTGEAVDAAVATLRGFDAPLAWLLTAHYVEGLPVSSVKKVLAEYHRVALERGLKVPRPAGETKLYKRLREGEFMVLCILDGVGVVR